MTNKQIVRRFSDELWGQGSLAAADDVLAKDLIEHNPLPGQGAGREGHKQVVALFRSAFPDLQVTTEDVLEEGDRVALRWRADGTHRGDLMGLAPTGKTSDIDWYRDSARLRWQDSRTMGRRQRASSVGATSWLTASVSPTVR
jgi:predicted ester cyclase